MKSTYFISCLDIATAGTISGRVGFSAIQGGLENTLLRNFYNITTIYNSSSSNKTQFGLQCGQDSFGDGLINSLDLAVLIFAMFFDPPYDTLMKRMANGKVNFDVYKDVPTTFQRLETHERCGLNQSRGMPCSCSLYNNFKFTIRHVLTCVCYAVCPCTLTTWMHTRRLAA